jgi:hypothetical protein
VLFLLFVALAGSHSILAEEDPLPEPIGTSVREDGDTSIYEAILPGEIVDWTMIPAGEGPGSLALLLEMDEESRQVVLWSLLAGGTLEDVGPSLSEKAETLFTLIGEDGGKTLMVAAGGTILGLGAEGLWEERYEAPYDVFPLRDTRGARLPDSDELIVRSVGLLQGLARDPNGRDLEVLWQFDLPLRVDREWGGLRLDTPPIVRMAWAASDGLQWVLGPEAHGKRRVRSVLLGPPEEGGDLDVVETWNLLPTAEDIEESWYVEFNGKPALIVTSVMAEKHGVFEKKKLRMFELSADRTRAGSRPLLEVMTRSRNWYRTCAGVADLDGDGLEDLVSAQPKGLGAGSLWVEGHIALPEGGFHRKPRGSEIELEEAEICSLGVDIDGDSRVELIAVEDDSLVAFSLIQSLDSKVVVTEEPQWRVGFHDIDGRPRPVEILDSGGSQILVIGHTEGKRQAARVVEFR